ncbi:15664_t:CDS:2, partial [Dentiscutata heterogama]
MSPSLKQLEGSEILDFIAASDELFLHELFNYSQEYLIEHKAEWVRQNLVHVLQIAFRHDACVSLQNFCFGLVNENAWALFQSEEFISIDEMILISLLKRDDFSVEEIDIWNFVINWGIEHTPSILERDISKWTFEDFTLLGTTLRNLLPLVRLFQITSKDFYHRVWPFEQILHKDLKEELLSFYLTKEPPKHVPLLEPRILQKNIDSEIISYNHAMLIASWINRKNPQSSSGPSFSIPTYFDIKDFRIKDKGIHVPYRLRLIYRASRDGFTFESFHKHVDNKGPAV